MLMCERWSREVSMISLRRAQSAVSVLYLPLVVDGYHTVDSLREARRGAGGREADGSSGGSL